jgi:hypothetical protein
MKKAYRLDMERQSSRLGDNNVRLDRDRLEKISLPSHSIARLGISYSHSETSSQFRQKYLLSNIKFYLLILCRNIADFYVSFAEFQAKVIFHGQLEKIFFPKK